MTNEELSKSLGKEVSFRSLNAVDTNFYRGVLTSITTSINAKTNFVFLENYHRNIKNVHHNTPDIDNLTWFIITDKNHKQIIFAFEYTSNFQFLNDKTINIAVKKVGEADISRINDLLKNAGYTNVNIS